MSSTEMESTSEPSRAPEPVVVRAVTSGQGRDVRIDFIRGWVMMILVIIHTEIFSLWNLIAWERVGMISGGEGFVLVSGIVLGMVSRQRIARSGFSDAASRLIDRALQLYRVHFTLILLVGILALVFKEHVREITSFTNRGSGEVYGLYPTKTLNLRWLGQIATLKCGPHQVQILGLYVCLILACPLMIAVLWKRRPMALLALSWIIYLSNVVTPSHPTNAQFEYGFPVLTWQILFVHGLVVGYHFQEIVAWFHTRTGLIAFAVCVAIAMFFFVVTQGQTNSALPTWARLDAWPAFYQKVRSYCDKNTLGPLRLLNYGAFLVVLYAILTRWWPFFQRTMAWYFIPIGQASLYVFIMHLGLVQLASMIVPFGFKGNSLWATTAIHTSELVILWMLVHWKVLFRWIPR
ncbi:MAG: OpgC domain-containing protein [Kofleriaceae bacterium]